MTKVCDKVIHYWEDNGGSMFGTWGGFWEPSKNLIGTQ
jgi:hypothetical protein